MTETPASPRATRLATPSWLDTRLVLGVLLVLASVVVGARVLSSADRSEPVWVTTRSLAPGSVLTDDDLREGRARLFGQVANYVSAAGPKPVGYIARRGIGAGELLPVEALTPPDQDEDYRLVTVAVDAAHLPPDLAAQQQVDVWVTPDPDEQQPPGTSLAPRLVLGGVTVAARERGGGFAGGASDEQPVVLRVRPQQVGALVAAMAQGQIDLVRVPRYQEREQPLVAVTPAG